MKKSKNTVLLGLNELNFEFISYYISKGKLKNFKRLFELQNPIKTKSESEYRLLGPGFSGLQYTPVSLTPNMKFSDLVI